MSKARFYSFDSFVPFSFRDKFNSIGWSESSMDIKSKATQNSIMIVLKVGSTIGLKFIIDNFVQSSLEVQFSILIC